MTMSEYRLSRPVTKSTLYTILRDLTRAPLHERTNLDAEMEREIAEMRNVGLPDWEVEWAEREHRGGNCPVCGQPWVAEEVRNLFLETTLYKPGCTCFPLCCYCDAPMYREIILGLPHCSSCGAVIGCQKWHEVMRKSASGGEKRVKQRCKGVLEIQSNGALKCNTCGKDVTRMVRYVDGVRRVYEYPPAMRDEPARRAVTDGWPQTPDPPAISLPEPIGGRHDEMDIF